MVLYNSIVKWSGKSKLGNSMKQADKECNPNVFGSSEEKMGTS